MSSKTIACSTLPITVFRKTVSGFSLSARERVFHFPIILKSLTNGTANTDPGQLFNGPAPTVWDALRDIPEADDFEELLYQDWVEARFKKPSKYGALLWGIESALDDYSALREFDSRLLTSSLRTVHTPYPNDAFVTRRPGKPNPSAGSPNSIQRAYAIRFVPGPRVIRGHLHRRDRSIHSRRVV